MSATIGGVRFQVVLATGLAGCSFSAPDGGGGEFACSAAAPECPSGTMCIDGRCRVPADAAPPPAGFRFRQKLTFDNLKHGTVAEAPVLVALDTSVFDYSEAAADGSDLRFFDPDNVPLPHEVESWRAEGRSLLWVKVPEVTGNSGQDYIWLYYGHDDPPPPPGGDVWSAYQAVYHMGESGADSGALGLDGVFSGTESEIGQIGQARRFDGVSDHMTIGPEPPLLRGVAGMSLEAWVRHGSPAGAADEVVVSVSVHGGDFSRAQIKIDPTDAVRALFRTQDVLEKNAVYTLDAPLVAGEWTWVVAAVDLTDGTIRIAYDADRSAGSMTTAALDDLTSDTVPDGALVGMDESGGEWFVGSLDEVRIAGRAPDEDWLGVQYASMTGALVGFEEPEALAP